MRQNQSRAVAHAVMIAIQGRKLQKPSASASVNASAALVYSARILDAFDKTV
jgi:hypothetical protein